MISSLLLATVVTISSSCPRYFETADGKPWIPIGCNICFDRSYDGAAQGDAEVRARFDRWLRAFAANGGNSIRLWAGHRSLEVMPERAGVYDPGRTETLKGIISLCERLGWSAWALGELKKMFPEIGGDRPCGMPVNTGGDAV